MWLSTEIWSILEKNAHWYDGCDEKSNEQLLDSFILLHKHGHSITLLLSFSFIVFSPLLRLSPPPGDHDYIYNLDETEGLCDLFDVPIANLWPPNTPYNESSVLKRTFFFNVPFWKEKKRKCGSVSDPYVW